jgi:hypothetical protein
MSDPVNHPKHYNGHSSGIECIDIAETLDFNPGNAFKYIWRFRDKDGLKDLNKALWYVRREIDLLSGEQDGVLQAVALSRVMAHEPNPSVSLLFWYLTAADHMRGERAVELFKEAAKLIEGLIHDTLPTPR